MQRIDSVASLVSALEHQGTHTWPGGYPIYFVTRDGEPMSYTAVSRNRARVIAGMRDGDPQWTVIGMDVNWEDPELYCCHTGERIESAYAEEEVADG